MKSTTLFFARHGESHSNNENRIQGHTDSGLSLRGRRQAKKLANRIAKLGIKKIISSDLGRAHDTAKFISEKTSRRIHLNPELREIRLGDWEGMSVKEVDDQYDMGYQKWLQSPTKMKIPGAETVKEFHSRVRNAAAALFDRHKSGSILVVTHGGVIASLLSYWLKADFDQVLLNLRVDNTSLTIVERNPHRFKIHALNDTSHLNPSDLGIRNIFTER